MNEEESILSAGMKEEAKAVEFEEVQEEFTPEPRESALSGILDKLFTTETGEGSIQDYKDHPLNFNSTEAMAQVLRGLTGFGANLKLAIIDIAIGLFKMRSPKGVKNEY